MTTGDDRSAPERGATTTRHGRRPPRGAVLGAAVAALIAAAAWGLLWWNQYRAEAEFRSLAEQGQTALARVETFPAEGRDHVLPGERVRYATDPPTSGPHDPEPVDPGFYDRPQAAEKLVHSLEHGHIVIYYDEPGAAALETLEAWARRYADNWDGVIAVPKEGLGRAVVLAAWTRMLRLEAFDAADAAAFTDAFRGRGPEHPVR